MGRLGRGLIDWLVLVWFGKYGTVVKDKLWKGAGLFSAPEFGKCFTIGRWEVFRGRFFVRVMTSKPYLCKTGEIRKKTGLGAGSSEYFMIIMKLGDGIF